MNVNKNNLCIALISTLTLLAASASANGTWEVKLESENRYDEDGDRTSSLEPTLIYQSGPWKTHIEYEKQVHPESRDGRLEWQFDYRWKLSRSTVTLRSEVLHDLDRDRTRAELTPRWMIRTSPSLQLGFDLEIDYFDDSADSQLDIFEIEIEPTLMWTRKFPSGRFRFELEAPVLRLYSNNKDVDDVEYEGIEPILSWRHTISDASNVTVELKLPYDAEAEEWEARPNLAWRHRF